MASYWKRGILLIKRSEEGNKLKKVYEGSVVDMVVTSSNRVFFVDLKKRLLLCTKDSLDFSELVKLTEIKNLKDSRGKILKNGDKYTIARFSNTCLKIIDSFNLSITDLNLEEYLKSENAGICDFLLLDRTKLLVLANNGYMFFNDIESDEEISITTLYFDRTCSSMCYTNGHLIISSKTENKLYFDNFKLDRKQRLVQINEIYNNLDSECRYFYNIVPDCEVSRLSCNFELREKVVITGHSFEKPYWLFTLFFEGMILRQFANPARVHKCKLVVKIAFINNIWSDTERVASCSKDGTINIYRPIEEFLF